ncbi:MAG: DsbA family protein [Acidobacteria bacterium]|nr:DsbA family protein [Acidobacteriota bacterium]
MTITFGITWDYRCPFARIVHKHIVDGLLDGADWSVEFVPFSLGQVHVEEGESPIWERPADDTGILALQAAVVVRDTRPEQFPTVHRALFEARHAQGAQLRDEPVLRELLAANGVDPDPVFAEVATGRPLATIRDEHTRVATDLDVWGVPTFMVDGRAAFVRLMDLPTDAADARRTVERLVAMLGDWPSLNEFKHTSLDR